MKHNRHTRPLMFAGPDGITTNVTLVTLSDHNAQAAEAYRKLGEPCMNGIACPSCGKELVDTSPGITLTSCPAQKHIHCSACDYKGTRYC